MILTTSFGAIFTTGLGFISTADLGVIFTAGLGMIFTDSLDVNRNLRNLTYEEKFERHGRCGYICFGHVFEYEVI